jgi:hypothetical protein
MFKESAVLGAARRDTVARGGWWAIMNLTNHVTVTDSFNSGRAPALSMVILMRVFPGGDPAVSECGVGLPQVLSRYLIVVLPR